MQELRAVATGIRPSGVGLALVLALAPSAQYLGSSPLRFTVVTGVVYDSVARAPLADAEVQLMREGGSADHALYSVRTNERGAFTVADVEAGAYLASFFHARLDSLGIEAPVRRVEVLAERSTRLVLAIPSRATILRAFCPPKSVSDSTTLFLGFVRDAIGRGPRADAVVSAHWSELVVGKGGVFMAQRGGVAHTAADGRFAICNAPPDAELLVRAAQGADTSGVIVVRFPRAHIVGRDLFVGKSEPAALDSLRMSDSVLAALPAARRGDARLSGMVRGAAGEPLRGARVLVWGTVGEATTDESGAFRMAALPAGTYMLEARAIGHEPTRVFVDLFTGDETANAVTVVLERHTPALDTVRVIAAMDIALARNGFEQRRRAGVGRFIDRAAIERRKPLFLTDLFQTIPGVDVRPAFGRHFVLMRALRGYCVPEVYIDGMRYRASVSDSTRLSEITDIDLDFMVNLDRVAGIEVYSRLSQRPLEFGGTTFEGCGAIVIWTSSRLPAQPRPKKP